jgi:cysteine synthase A
MCFQWGSFMTRSALRDWTETSISRIEADYNRSADTNLLKLELPALPSLSLYIKDESTHPTGSLKHRLARSMFVYALCNGWLTPDTTIIEASSGSTAVSEAYFARLIGLRFIAVVPRGTSAEKIAQIRLYNGECHFVDRPEDVHSASCQLAAREGGHFMDQFTYAERAVDWRSRGNIASSIFTQLAAEPQRVPHWIVCGAGTGGTSATIGRYIRYKRLPTNLCLADPVGSIFHRLLRDPGMQTLPRGGSLIEGIGRTRTEASFLPQVIDRAIAVPDVASIAAARVLSRRLGKLCGGSTGTNLWASVELLVGMIAEGREGSLVTILCDSGERYRSTYFNDAWLEQVGIDCASYEASLEDFLTTGCFHPPEGSSKPAPEPAAKPGQQKNTLQSVA